MVRPVLRHTAGALTLSALLCLILCCALDQTVLTNLLDDTPVRLNPVSNPLQPPEGLPNGDSCDVPPQPIDVPFPAYPESLRQRRAQGQVTLCFVIDSLGVPGDPQIVFASDTLFARSVLDGFAHWKIAPAQIDGRPVSCYKVHTFDFMLGR